MNTVPITYAAIQYIIEYFEIKKANKSKADEIKKRVIRIKIILNNAKDSPQLKELLDDVREQLSAANEIAREYITNRDKHIIRRRQQTPTTQQPISQITTTNQCAASTNSQPENQCCRCCPYVCSCSAFRDRIAIYWNCRKLKATVERLEERITQANIDAIFGTVTNLDNFVDEVFNHHQQELNAVKNVGVDVKNVSTDVKKVGADVVDMNTKVTCMYKDLEQRKLDQEPKQYTEEELQPFISYLKEKYKYQYSNITRLMTNDTYPITDSYINLSIVQNEGKESDEINMEIKKTGVTTYEQIFGSKKLIDIKNLFHPDDKGTAKKRVAVYGRAGIGKTTFCQYLVHEWATGALYQQFKYLFWIRLRDLTERFYSFCKSSPYTLNDIVKRACFGNELNSNNEKYLQYILKDLSSSILWILDGYDELSLPVPDHLNPIFNTLVMHSEHLIVTSRPTTIFTYPIDGLFEIGGFTDNNIENYIKKFYGSEINDQQNLINILKFSPNVWGICHIPISLEIFCTLWPLQRTEQHNKPMTITKLYKKMIEWLLRHYLSRKNSNEFVGGLGTDTVFEKCKKELEILDEIAFRCITSSNLIVNSEVCLDVVKEKCRGNGEKRDKCRKKVMDVGVLKYVEGGSKQTEDKSSYFIHLTFQEFFAARQLKRLLENKNNIAIEFIKKNKYNSRYQIVFTFLAGLLNKEGVDKFFEVVNAEPRDLLDTRHSELLVMYLEETNIQEHGSVLGEINDYLILIIKQYDDHRYRRFLTLLGRSYDVLCQNIIENTILTHLNNNHVNSTLLSIKTMESCSLKVFEELLHQFNIESWSDKSMEFKNSICTAFDSLLSSSLISSYLKDELIRNNKIIENVLIRIISVDDIYGLYHGVTNFINKFESMLSIDFKQELQKVLLSPQLFRGSNFILYWLNKSIRQPIASELLSRFTDKDENVRAEAIERSKLLLYTCDEICVKLISIYVETSYDDVKNKIEELCKAYDPTGRNDITYDTIKEIENIYCKYQVSSNVTYFLSKILLRFLHEHPEHISSLSQSSIEHLILFCRDYITKFTDTLKMPTDHILSSMDVLIHNSCTSDQMIVFLKSMLKNGDKNQCLAAASVLQKFKEDFNVKYEIVQKLLDIIDNTLDEYSLFNTVLHLVHEMSKNTQVVKILEDSVLQLKNIWAKRLAGQVLCKINQMSNSIILELFEQVKEAHDDQLKGAIFFIFCKASAQVVQSKDILKYCLECIGIRENTRDLLRIVERAIAEIWIQSPQEDLLEQVLNINSHAATKRILALAAEDASDCSILNQLINRVNKPDHFQMLEIFCRHIQNPRFIYRLIDVVQSSTTNATVKSNVEKILFTMGKPENSSRKNLSEIMMLHKLKTNRNDESGNDICKFNANYLSYFSNESISEVREYFYQDFFAKLIPLEELLRVYLLTGNRLWFDIFIDEAIRYSTAITIDRKEKYVLFHENNETKKVLVEKEEIFNDVVKNLSEWRNHISVLDDEKETNIVQSGITNSIENVDRITSDQCGTDIDCR